MLLAICKNSDNFTKFTIYKWPDTGRNSVALHYSRLAKNILRNYLGFFEVTFSVYWPQTSSCCNSLVSSIWNNQSQSPIDLTEQNKDLRLHFKRRGQHSVVCCLCVQSILQFVIQSNLNVNTFKTFKVLQKYEMNKLDGFSQNTQNKKFNCCFEFQNKRRIAPSQKTLRRCPSSQLPLFPPMFNFYAKCKWRFNVIISC